MAGDSNAPRARNWKLILGGHGLTGALVALLLWLFGVFSANPGLLKVLLDGPKPGQTITITVPQAAVDQASSVFGEQKMRGEAPAGMTPAQLDKVEAQQDALAASDQLPIVTPDAAPEQRGCKTELVQDYSSRRGVRPRIFVMHYTVSPNRPGWSDVDSIVSLFNTPAFQASSNYVIDAEGHCAYIVRESDKAWTQAALNPVSISIEQINTGHEATYAGTAGLAKDAMVVSDALKRWEIPVQLGKVVNGVVVTPGIVDHGMLGVAGGGHHDISPYSVEQVIAAVKAFRAKEAAKAPKPTLTPAAQLRAKTGYWPWLNWRLGSGLWKGYGRADPKVRPRVPTKIPAAWWRQAAAHAAA
jgi:hypothetical protein